MSSRHSNSNKIIVVVVLALVVLFGVGQFFSASNVIAPANQTTSTSTQNVPVVPATQVIAYVPPQPASSTPTEKGSCWTNSIAAPFRADAWRCAVENSISDPCFEIPGSTGTLLCGIDPAVTNSTSTFVLKLTQPLPEAQVPPGLPPSDWAWLIQLGDGTLCSPFTGTLPPIAGGQSANYDCAPGPLGNNLLIFNDLNTSSSVWTASVGTISTGSTSSLPTIESSTTVPISTIWQ
jgi:hypothetical protein